MPTKNVCIIGSCMQNDKHWRAIGDHKSNTHNIYATVIHLRYLQLTGYCHLFFLKN